LAITARRYVLVSVTRRQHRHKSVPVDQKAVTVQACLPAGREGLARFLASSYKFLRALRVSRYRLSRSEKTVKVQDINYVQMRALPTVAERRWVSGYMNHYKFVLSAGAIKNRDKLIIHTVRVICSGIIILFSAPGRE
jgi:hypothetical protein